MHFGSLVIGFVGGVFVSVLFSIYRAKKWAKVQEEVKGKIS